MKILKLAIFTAAFLGLGLFVFSMEARAATPKCSDGINNDPTEDSLVDFPNDPDCVSDFDQSESSSHPFLLVTEDMYGDMRARYMDNRQPWKQMGDEAIANCKNLDGKIFYSYGNVTKAAVEGVGLNWNDVSGKLKNNGWAKQTDPNNSTQVKLILDPETITGQLKTIFGSSYSVIFPILRDATAHEWYDQGEPIAKITNGCALAYILETNASVRQSYFEKYQMVMQHWTDFAKVTQSNCSAGQSSTCVIIASAYVMSIIATDIFYNNLSPTELNVYNVTFKALVPKVKIKNHNNGTAFIWAIWANSFDKTVDVGLYKDDYLHSFFGDRHESGQTEYVSEDGAYPGGSYYAVERNIAGGHRAGKFGPLDIATFAGYHNFYADERFEKLFQWDFHFALTPQLRSYFTSFGDMPLREGEADNLPRAARLYTLNNWSDDLAGHAAWLINGSGKTTWSATSLFAYVNAKDLPAPIKPTSRIFLNGGAAFWEDNPSDQSLMGSIQSMDLTEWHTHNQTNAIDIIGYGERLITNLGAVSYNDITDKCKTPDGAFHTMTSTKKNSHAANTVAINWDAGKHIIKAGYDWPDTGKGISEGFLDLLFNYASADSGAALPNGQHQRNFIFVHPEAGKNNGYFVLLDEVMATGDLSTNTTAQMYLHTLSDELSAVSTNLEYKARTQLTDFPGTSQEFKHHTNETNASVSIFLGTPPSTNLGAVIKENSGNGVTHVDKDFNNNGAFCRYVDYLWTNYDLNLVGGSRKKNIVTILFPSDNTHTKALMSRILGTKYSGAEIAHSTTIKDYTLESSSANPVIYNGTTFQGLASMYRISNNENEFYFVRKGKEFNDGKTNKKGFTSNNPISVYIKDKTGKIIVPAGGATVTFFYPGITGIKIDGATRQNDIDISGGNHDVEILTGPVLNLADVNGDTHVNIKDIQICVKAITAPGSFTTPDQLNQLARCQAVALPIDVVNIKDIQAIIREIVNPSQ